MTVSPASDDAAFTRRAANGNRLRRAAYRGAKPGDQEIITILAQLPLAAQVTFRRTCSSALQLAPPGTPMAAVWSALSKPDESDALINRALSRCSVDELQRLRDTFRGVAIAWWGTADALWLSWTSCANMVADAIDARREVQVIADTLEQPQESPVVMRVPAASPVPAQPTPVALDELPERRSDAVVALLEQYPGGLPTQDVTRQLGGSAARQALRRLRQSGKVVTRDGLNFAVVSAVKAQPHVRQ
jgi:hypothetical protein